MEFTLVRSENQMVKEAIKECFASDKDLLARWHISAPASLEVCVNKTLRDLGGADRSFQFFMAFSDETLAGYFGTEFGNYINLIFVKPEFRNKAFMGWFWDAICEQMKNVFTTSVYAKNKPALEFYSKHGQKISEFEHDGHPAIRFVFIKKVSDLCQ